MGKNSSLPHYQQLFYQKNIEENFDYEHELDQQFIDDLSNILGKPHKIIHEVIAKEVETSKYAYYLLLHPANPQQQLSRLESTYLLASLRTLNRKCTEPQTENVDDATRTHVIPPDVKKCMEGCFHFITCCCFMKM